MPPLHVLLVTHEYPPQLGGLGVSSRRIARLLAQRGARVDVVCFDCARRPFDLDACVVREERDGLSISRVTVSPCPYDAPAPPDGFARPVPQNRTPMNKYEMYSALSRLVRASRPSLLLGMHLFPSGFIVSQVGAVEGIPVVTSIRGNDIGKDVFDPARLPYITRALASSDYVVACAPDLLALADVIHPIRRRARVILNSLEPPQADADADAPLPVEPGDGRIVGAVGMFKYKKGLIHLLRAMAPLFRPLACRLLLVGEFVEPVDRARFLATAAELDVEDCVTLTGFVPRSQIPRYLKTMHVFALPSLFSEGCPSGLLEAMRARRPIVASRVGAVPEIVTDGVEGLLVEPGATASLRAAIRRLLNDEALADGLARNAAAAVEGITAASEAQAWWEVCERALSNAEQARGGW